MKGLEARTTKAGRAMAVLTTVVTDSGTDDAVWCTVLAFEDLAERLAGLTKGAEIYAKGRLKADLYTPEGGEPRVSLTLMASSIEPMTLERSKPRKRPPAVYGAGTQHRPADTSRRPATAGAFEPFDDRL